MDICSTGIIDRLFTTVFGRSLLPLRDKFQKAGVQDKILVDILYFIKYKMTMTIKTPSQTYKTMSEIAFSKLQESILRGVYPPGTHLVPAELESHLGVGRVAIREALRELSGVGLVVTIPNKGTMVAKAKNKEELREIFEMRTSLEGKAVEIACQKIEESDIDALEALNEKMAECILDSSDYFFLNRKFHLDLYQISGWSFLCQIIGMLYDRTLIFRNTFPFQPESIKEYINYHRRLLEALRRKDGEAARKIMEDHVHDGLRHFMERVSQLEESEE